MVKFINNWMFASHLWDDADPTPVAINIREITHIEQVGTLSLGRDVTAIFLKDDKEPIPIEDNIIEVFAEFQKHLTTNINN